MKRRIEITIKGFPGGGKSTIAEVIEDALKRYGNEVLNTDSKSGYPPSSAVEIENWNVREGDGLGYDPMHITIVMGAEEPEFPSVYTVGDLIENLKAFDPGTSVVSDTCLHGVKTVKQSGRNSVLISEDKTSPVQDRPRIWGS